MRLESGSFVEGDFATTITAEYAASNIYAEGDGSCSCARRRHERQRQRVRQRQRARLRSRRRAAEGRPAQRQRAAEQPGLRLLARRRTAAGSTSAASASTARRTSQRNIYWEATAYLAGLARPAADRRLDREDRRARRTSRVTDQHGNPIGPRRHVRAPATSSRSATSSTTATAPRTSPRTTSPGLALAAVRPSDHAAAGREHLGQRRPVHRPGHVEHGDDPELLAVATLVTHEIEVDRPRRQHDDQRHRRQHPRPDRHARERRLARRGSRRTASTFEFDIKHTFPPTTVKIENLQPNTVAELRRRPRRDDRQPDRHHRGPERPRQHPLRAGQPGQGRAHEHRAARRAERLDRDRGGLHRRASPIVLQLVRASTRT